MIVVICLLIEKKLFSATESREVSLKGNVYDYLIDYNSLNSNILNIHNYSMVKNKNKIDACH